MYNVSVLLAYLYTMCHILPSFQPFLEVDKLQELCLLCVDMQIACYIARRYVRAKACIHPAYKKLSDLLTSPYWQIVFAYLCV